MRLAALLLVTLLFASGASAQTLVGLTSCCPNEVVTITAGDTTTVASIGGSGDAFIATVGSLVLDADGGRAFLVRNGQFAAIDLATGAVEEQAEAGTITQLAGFDAGRGLLYAFATARDTLQTRDDVLFQNYVVAYDPATRDTVRLAKVGEYLILNNVPQGGDTFATVTGPAVASSDALYTIRNGRLVAVDLGTGVVTEGSTDLPLPEVTGTAGTWLYRTEREVVTNPDTSRTFTARLLRQPLAGGPDAPADTVAVFGTALVDTSGAFVGDSFLASFGISFYDAAGDRILLNRNGQLVEVDLGTTQARVLGAAGRIRYVPGPAPAVVSVGGGPEAGRLALGAAPNPARGPVGLALTLGTPANVEVSVFDALGRHVALLHEGPLAAGTHTLAWDGDAAPGVYVVRATASGETVSLPVTVVR